VSSHAAGTAVAEDARPETGISRAAGTAAAHGAIALFAFLLPWWTGHRGLFLLDQSVVFDGGWRILEGEIPYRDLLSPFGPVTFYIQAFFFRLFGVNWTAMVAAAALLNTLGALSAMRTVRLLTGAPLWTAAFTGLLVAATFQAPFGTLWIEQTALWFNVLALQAVAESFGARRNQAWLAAAGALQALAILSKQNFGFFFAPVLVFILAWAHWPGLRRVAQALAAFGAGLALTAGAALALILRYTDFQTFYYYFFGMAGQIGRARLRPAVWLNILTFDVMPMRYQFALVGLAMGAAALALARRNLTPYNRWPRIAAAAAAAFALPFYHSLTQATSHQEYQNNLMIPALAFSLGLALWLRLAPMFALEPVESGVRLPSRRWVTRAAAAAMAAWGLLVLAYAVRSAWYRDVQQFGKNARFGGAVNVAGLESVTWGDGSHSTSAMERADLENTVRALRERARPFFVMGDATLLYGLLGQRPPQPLLYFIANHSFLPGQVDSLDRRIVQSLRAAGVAVIVREKSLHLGNTNDYARFPETWRWFETNFRKTAEYGFFEIWERADAQ
jgi:hypothetical protein